MSQLSDRESIAFEISWSSAPGVCDYGAFHWSGVDHYELHRTDGSAGAWDGGPPGGGGTCTIGASAPSSPGATTLVKDYPIAGTVNDFVHQASTDYAYVVFACEDSTIPCTSWYGMNGEGHNSDTATNCTTTEQFETTYITGSSDYHINVVETTGAIAQHALFYPSSWDYYASTLALYFGVGGVYDSGTPANSTPSTIWYKRYNSTHWPADGFNCDHDATGCSAITAPRCCTTDWADSDAETLVAQGSIDSDDDDFMVDHPWAFLTASNMGGDDQAVVLMAQTQFDAWGFGDEENIVQITSSDAVGDDFDRDCSGSSCTYSILGVNSGYAGSIAVEPDGTSATDYLSAVRHSRMIPDYISQPWIIEGTDEPEMWIQMMRPGTDQGYGCYDTGYDDIGLAIGSYSSGWTWAVDTEVTTGASGSDDCVAPYIEDHHDISGIPLPGGRKKAYVKGYADEIWYVIYWDPDTETWGESSPIEFYWDGGTTQWTDHECVEDVSAVVHANGATYNEGMFFKLQDEGSSGTGCTTASDGYFDSTHPAIVFAEHVH